ncbi:hypothetical protein BC831DRAFT_461367 [Entophlyctis helioformis]|nr:hypothetical protein BC831DRAFT_461367 [Entophlyctis helioformis]
MFNVLQHRPLLVAGTAVRRGAAAAPARLPVMQPARFAHAAPAQQRPSVRFNSTGSSGSSGSASSSAPHLEPIDPIPYLLTGVAAVAGIAGSVLAYVYLTDTRASVYKWLGMPLMHALYDPEEGHKLSIWLAKHGLVPRERTTDDELLKIQLWGKTVTNPLGLAAGYDKHAEAVDSLFGFGFGLVEIGSVTPKPQPGNPKPRMFRLPQDKAVINRYGFNSEGHGESWFQGVDATAVTKTATPPRNRSLQPDRLLGVNLGKNKTSPADSNDDYVAGIAALGAYADYLVINISSPNTPGLRALQRREPIERLLRDAKTARDTLLPAGHRPPLLVKIAPDLGDSEIEDVAAVVASVGVDGVIISNTTISRPDTLASDTKLSREFGGLSGPPVLPLALRVVSRFYALTGGSVPIIGCGGIRTAEDALAFAAAGASAVQVPGLVHDIKVGVTDILSKRGVTWSDVVGADHRRA